MNDEAGVVHSTLYMLERADNTLSSGMIWLRYLGRKKRTARFFISHYPDSLVFPREIIIGLLIFWTHISHNSRHDLFVRIYSRPDVS
jgi:hypothetical protein